MRPPPTSFKSWAEWYEDAATKIDGPYRGRVLTYGPEAARILLEAFDYLGEWIDAEREAGTS